jgi:hypothetical protein
VARANRFLHRLIIHQAPASIALPRTILSVVSDAFTESLRALALVPDAHLNRSWSWEGRPGGGPQQVRDALYRALEAEQVALVDAAAPSSDAGAILDLAQTAFGDLRGLLACLPDPLLDQEPGHGEWTVRKTLTHILMTEWRYAAQVRYAATRTEQQPVYVQLDIDVKEEDRTGDVRAWIARLAQARTSANESASLPLEVLQRPTRWSGFEVDVRFRLHRFAAHLWEHTIQVEKILALLAYTPTEAGRIARVISRVRGAHERLSLPEVRRSLDADLATLAAKLSALPA